MTTRPSIGCNAEAGVIPVSDDLWVTAEGASVLRLKQTADMDMESLDSIEEGISRLRQLCFAHLQLREDTELAVESHRLDERQKREELDTSDALSQLTVTLRRQDAIPRLDTDFMTALGAVGKQLGVTFKPPANSEDMRRVADPIVAIPASGIADSAKAPARGNYMLF